MYINIGDIVRNNTIRRELNTGLLLFIIEGFLYLTFRSTELNMFHLYNHAGPWVQSLRAWGATINLPFWVQYSLPDGLWLLSYLLLIDAIWQQFDRFSAIWYLCMPSIAFGSELAQVFWGLTGSPDKMDFVCYGAALCVFVTVYRYKRPPVKKIISREKKRYKTIISFIIAVNFLVSACGSIEGPEIWIYASVITVSLLGYSFVNVHRYQST